MPATATNGTPRAESPNSKVAKVNGSGAAATTAAAVVKGELVRSATESSVASEASSVFSSRSSSMSSATTVSSSSTTIGGSYSTKTVQLSLHDTCSKLRIEKGILYAECRRLDGSRVESTIDLNLHLGNRDGHLTWGLKAFTTSCKNITIQDGFWLVAECQRLSGEYVVSKFDLRTRLRNNNGILVVIVIDQKLSKMLTEVPWMKFKVIAEPDLSVFASHPVVKQTMVKVAESTVQHVTMQMSQLMTTAIQQAITVVTASAIQHISTEMEMVVQETVGFGATAHIHPSCTEGEYLHKMVPTDLTVCEDVACTSV